MSRQADVPVRGAEQARRDGRDVRRAAELHSQITNQRNGAHMFGSKPGGQDGSKRSSLNGSPLTRSSSRNVASMSKSQSHRGGGKRWGDTGKQHGPKSGW